MSDDAVLGTGAKGDPANPGWLEAEFEAHQNDAPAPPAPPDPPAPNDDVNHDDA